MQTDKLIHIRTLCTVYNVEESLISELEQYGLINTILSQNKTYIEEDDLSVFEKVLRMNRDLNINLEGIDVIFNLLNKIENLNQRLSLAENRLKIYEI